MGKFCTHCGNELGDNSNICLKCGVKADNSVENKKKRGLPAWAIILIVIVAVTFISIFTFIVGAVIGYIALTDDYQNDITMIEGTIGDTLESDDLFVTLNDAVIYSEIGVNKPSDGKEYLVFFFTIQNNDNETKYVSDLDFYGYVDDTAIELKTLTGVVDGYSSIGTSLAPRKKTMGYVAYEVPINWNSFEVHFTPLFEDELSFKVVNENIETQGA